MFYIVFFFVILRLLKSLAYLSEAPYNLYVSIKQVLLFFWDLWGYKSFSNILHSENRTDSWTKIRNICLGLIDSSDTIAFAKLFETIPVKFLKFQLQSRSYNFLNSILCNSKMPISSEKHFCGKGFVIKKRIRYVTFYYVKYAHTRITYLNS